MTTPLLTALEKLDNVTAKGVYLEPAECTAVLQYIREHGVSGKRVMVGTARRPKGQGKQ